MMTSAPAAPVPLIPFSPIALPVQMPGQDATLEQAIRFEALLTAHAAPAGARPVAVETAAIAVAAHGQMPEHVAEFFASLPAPASEQELPMVKAEVADLAITMSLPEQPVTATPETAWIAAPVAMPVALPVAMPVAAEVLGKQSERRADRAKLPERMDQPVTAPVPISSRLPMVQEAKAASVSAAFEHAPQTFTPIEISISAITPAPQKAFDLLAALAPQTSVDATVQLSERVLDTARGNAWLDQLAGDIIAAQDSDRHLSFRLMPPQLGPLDVKIETLGEGMQLNFAAQTEEAAQIVAAAQPRLVEELRGQGVRVAGSEVTAGSGQHAGNGHSHSQPQRQQHAQHFEQPTPLHKAAAAHSSGRFA